MLIYDIFAGMNCIIGLVSGVYLCRRAWKCRHNVTTAGILAAIAVGIFWISIIYGMSSVYVEFLYSERLTMGVWIRPVMPILLAGPALLVKRGFDE